MHVHSNPSYNKVEAARISIDGQMNKWWYIHTTEYYSTTKRNEVLIPATIRMPLQSTMLMKEARHKRFTLYDPIYIQYPEQVHL